LKPLFSIRVRVPATSANLGPGFDVLGLALTLYNEVRLTGWNDRSRPALTILNEGEGEADLPTDRRHLVFKVVERVFNQARRPLPPALELKLWNRIPLARGLGSSSAAILGGILAADAALGKRLSLRDIVQLAAEIEGHPDNVAPTAVGGLCVAAMVDGRVTYLSWKDKKMFRGLKAVVAVPDFEVCTAKARSVLPKTVSRADALFNTSRVALFLSALAQGRRELFGLAMEDRFHQPCRENLVPGLADAIASARKAGAFGAALSGAGPSVLALSPVAKAVAAGRAMAKVFARKQISSRVLILDVDFNGARVTR
jgi:homoserine kinase